MKDNFVTCWLLHHEFLVIMTHRLDYVMLLLNAGLCVSSIRLGAFSRVSPAVG